MNTRFRPWLWLAATISLCLLPIGVAQGQINSDGSLSTNVNSVDNANFTIDGGNRVGGNLFHSFGEFSVPTGGSAIFNNATDVSNIIGRVTGDSISNIDGLLAANGAANLFLLNPNGIIFGANSSLNIGGSLISSTAEAIVFADGTNYSARAAASQEPPLLTVSVPMGLQFGADPGAIVNRSIANPSPNPLLAGRPMGLQVESGRTLALVGGEVGLEGGNITPEGGRVELGSVGDNSLVRLNTTNGGFALDYAGVENFQDVRLSQGAIVDVTDFNPLAGSGDVRVQGRQIIVSGGSQIASFTTGPASSGSIELRARESVELIGTGTRQGFPLPSNLTTTTIGDGDAGDISITTKRLIVRDSAGIFTSSVQLPMQNSLGRAGNLRIMASELVELRGSNPGFDPSRLSVETRSNGAAGELQITTRRLVIEDGAEVTAATSEAAGRGGTIEILASESVELRGTGVNLQGEVVPSRLTARSEGAGDAGNLTVTTNALTVRDGAEIGVSGTGTGAAGNLEVQASRASLDNGRLRSETTAGDRGSIELNVGDILLRRNSSITTEATGTASGGNIAIDTTTLAALENSDITANAILGSGGNIFIRTRGLFLSPESEITASSQFGVSGTVEIVNPETDQASGLLELPENVEDLTNQVGAICAARKEESSFIVTGRGGIPEDPRSTLRGRVIWRDLQDFSEESQQTSNSFPLNAKVVVPHPPTPLVEATGWVVDSEGNVELVAMDRHQTAPALSEHPDCDRLRQSI
ncbi:MAG: filamentous hemagglutinin N-terminal domain-containing protein [Oscillatoria sp. SIO1A7]|nr:filamentous hemagglutinin N-terminal domain-containing protein [Oscillatoria sp. SIO1A7]